MAKDRLVRNYPTTCNKCGGAMEPGRKAFHCAACTRMPKHRSERADYMREYRLAHPERKERELEWQRKLRREAIAAYGGCCACCGENQYEWLEIDHTNGGGGKHRREIGGHFTRWAKKNGYPPGYRVLCGNCHLAITYHRRCPHHVV